MVSSVVAKTSGVNDMVRALKEPNCAFSFCVPTEEVQVTQASYNTIMQVAAVEEIATTAPVDPHKLFVFIIDEHEDLTHLFASLRSNDPERLKLPADMPTTFDALAAFAKEHFRTTALERGQTFAARLDEGLKPLRQKTGAAIPLVHCDVFFDHTEFKDFLAKTIELYNTPGHKFTKLVDRDAINFLSRRVKSYVDTLDLKNPLHAIAVLYVIRENAMLRFWAKANTTDCTWKNINLVAHKGRFNESMKWTFADIVHYNCPMYGLCVEIKDNANLIDTMDTLTLGAATTRPTKNFVSRPTSNSANKLYQRAYEEVIASLEKVKDDLDLVVSNAATRGFKIKLIDKLTNICELCPIELVLPNETDNLLTEPNSPPKTAAELIYRGIISSLAQTESLLSATFQEEREAKSFFNQSEFLKKNLAQAVSGIIEMAIGADLTRKNARVTVTPKISTISPPHSDSDDANSSPQSRAVAQL